MAGVRNDVVLGFRPGPVQVTPGHGAHGGVRRVEQVGDLAGDDAVGSVPGPLIEVPVVVRLRDVECELLVGHREHLGTGEAEEGELPWLWLPLDEAKDLVLAGKLQNPTAVAGILAAWVARAGGWHGLRRPVGNRPRSAGEGS